MRWWTAHSDRGASNVRRILEWYDRRIVNVNVNIIAAGLLALIPTAIVAHLAETVFLVRHWAAITIITFITDAVSDVAVYYLLHWIANHMPRDTPRLVRSVAYRGMSFVKDATLVQFERACLSPLLYVIALGGQFFLKRWGLDLVWATIIGFASAILVTRILHTIWMYRAEVRARDAELARLRVAGNVNDPYNPASPAVFSLVASPGCSTTNPGSAPASSTDAPSNSGARSASSSSAGTLSSPDGGAGARPG